jgi:serine phosphatase RsbU (regulator of sigma subunit)
MDGTPLDRPRLDRILGPLAADGGGLTVVIEDPDGAVLAGPAARVAGANGSRIAIDLVVDDAVIGRIVATGSRSTDAGTRPALAALGVAITELVREVRAREAADDALRGERAAAAADALGTDTVELAKGRFQQRSILSLEPPDVPGYDLASHYAAAREIGGDFFELFRLPRRGHPLGIVIADVTGKGLDAALLMAFSRPVMHSAINASRGPAEALERTNRVLVEERRGTLFITALCAVLEPRSGRLRVASAGHESPWLVPGDDGPIRPVGTPGVMMGAFAAIHPPEDEIVLAPGDTLFCYTDGVTDARGPSGARFGDARLLETLEDARPGTAHELVAAVSDAVRAFQGATEAADDVTIVAVGRARPRRRGRAPTGRASAR